MALATKVGASTSPVTPVVPTNVVVPLVNVPLGPVYRFNVYHLLELDDPCGPFPVELVEYGA